MAKTIFEQMGGTYTMQGDYCLPDLTLPAEEERPIGVWGQRRLNYLKHSRKVLYYNLLTSGKLRSHLADVEEEAQSLLTNFDFVVYYTQRIYRQMGGCNLCLSAESVNLRR